MLLPVRHDLSRLGSRVRQRRLELGLTQRQASLEARVSDSTWLAVENGAKVSERTLAGVERALGWAPGSAAKVAEGGEPETAGDPARSLEDRLEVLEAELRALRDELRARQRT